MHLKALLIPALALVALAGCNPPVPDSGARGAAFETPEQYSARREAELRTGARTGVRTQATVLPPATPPAPPPPPQAPLPARTTSAPISTAAVTVPPPATEAERLAQETRAVLGAPPAPAPTPLPSAPAPLPAATTTGTAAAVQLNRDNPEISREQDFGAVSAERSIQDDAARVQAARQQYQIVQPTELQRPDDNGPNIIKYALEQAKPVGASGTYRRGVLTSARRAAQNCQGYRTDDVAQEDFLSAGGPQQDRLNLDPDGDGNACGWNPATYRSLVRQ